MIIYLLVHILTLVETYIYGYSNNSLVKSSHRCYWGSNSNTSWSESNLIFSSLNTNEKRRLGYKVEHFQQVYSTFVLQHKIQLFYRIIFKPKQRIIGHSMIIIVKQIVL